MSKKRSDDYLARRKLKTYLKIIDNLDGYADRQREKRRRKYHRRNPHNKEAAKIRALLMLLVKKEEEEHTLQREKDNLFKETDPIYLELEDLYQGDLIRTHYLKNKDKILKRKTSEEAKKRRRDRYKNDPSFRLKEVIRRMSPEYLEARRKDYALDPEKYKMGRRIRLYGEFAETSKVLHKLNKEISNAKKKEKTTNI